MFWQPPVGWVPQAGVRPAPADWTFWVPNPTWRTSTAQHFRGITPWAQAANWLGVSWLVVAFASSLLGYPTPLRIIGLLLALGAIVCLVIHSTLRSRKTTELLAALAPAAAMKRRERLTREYQRYLRDVA